uniref:R13L1/DRL21-like LRR repeat region domain-containing protein n=1 Tax=Hordeum vulgare subsp. vulgare TaxID=112509 RepID=A0A8I6YZD2_HORVV
MREHDYIGFPSFSINNERELLEVLQPPTCLKSLFLQNYIGVSLPSWFQPQKLPSLKSLTFVGCVGFESISSHMLSQSINLNKIPEVGIFMSLTDLTIDGCYMLSSLEHFLHPEYVPAIKKIRIKDCKILKSIPTEKFGDLHFLEEVEVAKCPNICSQRLVSSSLKKLSLHESGLFSNIDCCSLTYFDLSCDFVTSIQLDTWSLPSLWQLCVLCRHLTSIAGSVGAFSSLRVLSVICGDMSTLDDLLSQNYLPAIEEINVKYCRNLLSLPGERFVSFTDLKRLVVTVCPSLNWQRGLVLPSSLQSLRLTRCGDISPCVPSCLQNLTSLVALNMGGCNRITSIPGHIWCSNLASLEELVISDFPDLVSIGGAKAVSKIKVLILKCPNLQEAEQINTRFLLSQWAWKHWACDELSNCAKGDM